MRLFGMSRGEIKAKVESRDLIICIFGLGKMGLPIACAFADAGFKVFGVDVEPTVVDNVNSGKTWFQEPGLGEKLAEAIRKGKLTATSDGARAARESDFIVCIVPLALDDNKKADFSSITQVAKTLSKNLRKGQTISFETTMPIGTTETLLKPILEESELKAGDDFGLVYAPERLMSGYIFSRLRELKKIIGGIDEKSSFIASEIYKTIHPAGTNIVENLRTAEMTKLAAGLWRDVNIAFANEMAKVADEYDIDILQIIKQVNSSPRRLMLRPGCGVGGHCIPVYPYFFINRVTSDIPLIEAARKTNQSMPGYTVSLAEEELKKRGKEIAGSTVVVLGLAFRPYIREVANSPTLDMVKILKQKGAEVYVFDPLFTKEEVEKITGAKSRELDKILKEADCVIISTMYRELEKVEEKPSRAYLIIDGRNQLKNADRGIGRRYGSKLI